MTVPNKYNSHYRGMNMEWLWNFCGSILDFYCEPAHPEYRLAPSSACLTLLLEPRLPDGKTVAIESRGDGDADHPGPAYAFSMSDAPQHQGDFSPARLFTDSVTPIDAFVEWRTF
jgi:hypothetical protein